MSASAPDADPVGPEPVGSVAEEAYKLFRALTSPQAGSASTDNAQHDTSAEHTCSTGWCPVCQIVGLVRDNPEAIASVTRSAAVLARSLRELVDTALTPKESQ